MLRLALMRALNFAAPELGVQFTSPEEIVRVVGEESQFVRPATVLSELLLGDQASLSELRNAHLCDWEVESDSRKDIESQLKRAGRWRNNAYKEVENRQTHLSIGGA